MTQPEPVSFQLEYAPDLFDEAKPLLEAHWREIAHFKHIPLEPDWDQYRKLAEMNLLRVFTARDKVTNEMIGYAVYFVRSNIHYKSSIQAVQDIIYINPYRRGFGREFISWCDEQLKSEGVQAVYHHVKKQHNFGPMLEQQGYELIDLIYGRRLD